MGKQSSVAFLLDTPTFFWWMGYAQRLSAHIRNIIESSQSDLYLSAASVMALEDSHTRKDLNLGALQGRLGEVAGRANIKTLAIEPAVATLAGKYDFQHLFTVRLIAAQARYGRLTLLSPNACFDTMGVNRVWETPAERPYVTEPTGT